MRILTTIIMVFSMALLSVLQSANSQEIITADTVGRSFANPVGSKGYIFLSKVFNNDYDYVKKALEEEQNPNVLTIEQGATPLIGACYINNKKMVNILLQYNADVNIVCDDGSSALMTAARMSDENIVQLLIKSGADINCKDKKNRTALQYTFFRKPNKDKKISITEAINIQILIRHYQNMSKVSPWVHYTFKKNTENSLVKIIAGSEIESGAICDLAFNKGYTVKETNKGCFYGKIVIPNSAKIITGTSFKSIKKECMKLMSQGYMVTSDGVYKGEFKGRAWKKNK